MSKQLFRTLFGDILTEWLLRHVEDFFIMSKTVNPYKDFVFGLGDEQFSLLCESINQRKDKKLYGYISFEEAALKYKREPACPNCGCKLYHKDGYTNAGYIRYRCLTCDSSYTLLSDSIFNSAKIPFHKLMNYIELMSFNVPLELMCEVLDIASNTAELWRKKIFSTIDNYQEHLKLYDTIWIDETYLQDYEVLESNYDGNKPRGLSKTQICIVVAIDSHKNMVAVICGHGKPSSKRFYNALKDHIKENSTIIHDGDNSHNYIIEKLNLDSRIYKANNKDESYLKNMAMINNMCGWLKRYIWRFIGMEVDNLQSYLNWFIYLQRCKRDDEIWPKNTRILRHLLLERVRFTRKHGKN